jgi:hypothetical protein
MAFPSPSLPAPALLDYELYYRGLTFGGITDKPYQLKAIPKGLEAMGITGGDVQRALDQGELKGIDLASGRDVEIVQILGSDEISVDHARQAFAGVMTPGGATEDPLYLQLPSGIFVTMARPRKHAMKLDVNTLVAEGDEQTALWHATDPRWYAAPTKSASVTLAEGGGGGLTFPAKPPFTFGGGTVGHTIEARNNGTVEMRPVLVFTGPIVNPGAENASLAGGPGIRFDLTLGEGDTLTVDMDFEKALLLTAGSEVPVSRRNSRVPGSIWWNMPPGLNVVRFLAEPGSTGSLTLQWADAYAGL